MFTSTSPYKYVQFSNYDPYFVTVSVNLPLFCLCFFRSLLYERELLQNLVIFLEVHWIETFTRTTRLDESLSGLRSTVEERVFRDGK